MDVIGFLTTIMKFMTVYFWKFSTEPHLVLINLSDSIHTQNFDSQ